MSSGERVSRKWDLATKIFVTMKNYQAVCVLLVVALSSAVVVHTVGLLKPDVPHVYTDCK